jgi:crotonobetainyl-CoA:carnitine CoA-transferase CaiB-like acyl-CoA transferase
MHIVYVPETHGLQIAGLANIASNYLVTGQEASRHGTAHPSIVPYQVFPCKDGFLMIGAGNDKQVTLVLISLSQEIRGDIVLIVQTPRGENPSTTCSC